MWNGRGYSIVRVVYRPYPRFHEYIKVRRQVQQSWKFSEVLSGSGATIFRNGFLFSSFVVYMDLTKQFIPGGLSPFVLGAFCSNMAWLTIWPLDVVKSQLQSGNYAGMWVVGVVLRDQYRGGDVHAFASIHWHPHPFHHFCPTQFSFFLLTSFPNYFLHTTCLIMSHCFWFDTYARKILRHFDQRSVHQGLAISRDCSRAYAIINSQWL